jgi:uncharacterized protein YcbK (DUF882 family)
LAILRGRRVSGKHACPKHYKSIILHIRSAVAKRLERGRIKRIVALLLGVGGISFAGVQSTQDAIAQGGTRSLTIYHAHTREQETITYKKYGSFDAEGLKQMNWILRDWRHDEPTRMDPILFDILWETYRASGSSAPIHVVSAYRSPGTNAMLARRSRGVAKNSQHMSGKAMDFNLPDVSMAKVRDIGLRLQNGGVGYYPRANNPWVHLDTGGVRHWPKVTRDHLVRLFPDEKTVHIPSDGRPLSGFESARSIIEARGGAVSSGYLDIASGKATGKTLFQILFGGGEGDEEDIAPARGAKGRTAVAARQRANQRVASAPADVVQPSDGSSAIAFFNQNSTSTSVGTRNESPAALASIRARPSRPTPLPDPKQLEEKPVEAKREVPVPDTPVKLETPVKDDPAKTIAVASLAPLIKTDAKTENGRWVNVALPLRRPANLAPSGPALVTVALPQKRPADLDAGSITADASDPKPDSKAVEALKPVQVASIGRLVSVPLPMARPSGLPTPETVGLRTASPAPASPAPVTTAPVTTALGYAPTQAIPRIIPAATASIPAKAPSQTVDKAKDRKSLDSLISQVAIGANAKGFTGSSIRPIASGFKTAE